jgi:hypothetical protein
MTPLALAALCASGCATWSATPPPNYVGVQPEAGSMWAPTEVLRPAGPANGGLAPYAVQRPAPAQQKSPQPAEAAQPPFRPSLEDETLRQPARPEAGAPAGGATGSTPARKIDAPSIPDPNAWAPQERALAGKNSNSGGIAPSGTGGQPPAHQRTGIERSAPAAGPSSIPAWEAIGRSAGGRPIEACRIGAGSRHLLVIGSLYGNEPGAVRFIELLRDQMASSPAAHSNWSVILVRTANPDGLIDATQTNARGVLLNRNFPSKNFAALRNRETGSAAASESETQLVLGLFDDFRPDRVVHVRSGNSERPLVLANVRAAQPLKQRLEAGSIAGGLVESFKVGSIEEYTSTQTSAELLIVWLPGGTEEWRNEVAALEKAIIGAPVSTSPAPVRTGSANAPADSPPSVSFTGGATDLFAPYTPPVKLTGEVQAAAPSGQKGYVQILPPPPEFADPKLGLDPKYFELPPPE